MTTPLMSRVEEASREHFKKVLPHLDTEYYFMPEKSHTIAAYVAGAKFVLTELTAATTARESAEARVAVLTEALRELLRVDDEWHGSVNSEMASARNCARQAISPEEQR